MSEKLAFRDSGQGKLSEQQQKRNVQSPLHYVSTHSRYQANKLTYKAIYWKVPFLTNWKGQGRIFLMLV